MHRYAIALASLCLLPLTSSAADDSATIRAIVDAAIRPVMAEHKVPGMAVAVTVDGKTYFLNYGLASREKKTPVSEATLFELGSISKTFTATLTTYAQVLGKLSLQFPDEVESQQQMLSYFQQWKPAAAPGAQRQYSNPSIGLFGHITALALKRDFADAMESQLFPQLGLKNSYVHVPAGAMANYAWGYNKENKAARVNPGMFDAEAYGGSVDAVAYAIGQHAVRQDRLHRWIWRLRGLRAATEDRHRHAGQQELSHPRPHQGGLCDLKQNYNKVTI
ncbi:hypothetical protein RugamoR64_47870 [Duganella rhizosphaerae]